MRKIFFASFTILLFQTVIFSQVNLDYSNFDNANLNGWTLVSEKGNQRCPLDGSIQSGEVLRIWTYSEQSGYSCGFQNNIWNKAYNGKLFLTDTYFHQGWFLNYAT